MRPADIALVVVPSDPRLSPDGTSVCFTVTRADIEANRYRSAVWTAPADGSAPARPITAGEHRDGLGRWSPDGSTLAFVSHRDGDGSELYALGVHGGEARRLAQLAEEIDELEWSPDGRWLAFGARQRDEAHYGPERDADRPPRRLHHLGWRFDGVGWRSDRPRSLWIVAADGTADARLVAAGTATGGVGAGCSWSPDSAQLAFCQGRHDTADVDGVVDLFVVDVTVGGAAGDAPPPTRQLTSGGFEHASPAWSSDGTTIALYRRAPLAAGENAVLCRLDVASGAVTEEAAPKALDRGRSQLGGGGPWWLDGDLLYAVEDRGATVLYRSPARPLLADDAVLGATHAAAGRVVTVSSTVERGHEVIVLDVGAGAGGGPGTGAGVERRTIAEFGPPAPVHRPERFEARSADGTAVDAWLIRPAGFDAGSTERHPVLVNIHGGPYTQYGHGFFDEFQVQAAAGYAVLYANPRGSSGYGQAWGDAIRGPACAERPGRGWGSVDAEDVTAVLDTALARWDFLDAERLGVLGGSYGGYLTSWLIGHTDRFRAACSERAVNNLLSMMHTSDIGWWFNTGYLGTDDPGFLLERSPVTYADAVTTPLLIVHSEADWRCPIEQGEDLFGRLRRRGHDVEMVRFAGEGHELSRSGSPRHRVERFEIILEFFDRHLGPRPGPGA